MQLEGSIPQRFEAQAATWPDRPAVRSRGVTVSFRQLNRQANRVAHVLLGSSGDSPGAVALLFPQGPDLVAALLGVPNAGKYYLGLDPSASPDDLAELVTDAGAQAILTTSSGAPLARTLAPRGVAVHEIDGQACAGCDSADPDVQVTPDQIAYLFYTSPLRDQRT